ncbi:MAG: fatty acid desaturase [Chitinophagaceae bacterium]|nr:fatty acid desaturase [Chitinophagaceae bacterium]
MISLPFQITDPVYIEKPLSKIELFLMRFIKDKKDLPFLKLLISIHIFVVPVAILLFTPLFQGWLWWAIAIPYFYVSQFYYKGSFGLMLHCLCHRKTWKPAYLWIQKYILWFLCPLFGHLGEGYYSHHIGMHHVVGNMPEDTSSTMAYQRDSFKDFVKYWLKFMAFGVYETYLYFVKRKMPKFYVPLTLSETLFILFAIIMLFVNFKATMIVFVVPFFFARFVMMLGNWTQHAFVDPDHPDDELANSVICINTAYNHKCWNDGYHAFHHLRQAAHYTEYPLMLRKHLPELKQKRTFIFSGIHYLHIFTWLMLKRYDKLAENLVNIDGVFSSKEDAIRLMKQRTRKFDFNSKDTAVFENEAVGNAAA